jgi:hypothetical protein
MVKNSSTPDPWGSNQHAAQPRGAAGSSDQGRGMATSSSGHAPNWGDASAPAAWGTASAPAARRELVRPPYALLWIALAAALLALVLSVLPGGLPVAVLAWALAALVGFGAAVMFVQRDARRQAEVFYVRDPRSPWLYRLAIALSFLAVVLAAVRIALIVGRMG